MKKFIKVSVIILTFFVGVIDSQAAICDCGAPPECGHSRPPQCPLELRTLKCNGEIDGIFVFDENLSPRPISYYQEPVSFNPYGNGNPFVEGGASIDGAENRFTVNYRFSTQNCILRFSIDSIHDQDGLGWSSKNVYWQCGIDVPTVSSTCKIDL